MSDIIFQLHTPEEFRYLSSLAHWIAGYIFLGVAIIAFFQINGFLKSQKYLWPILVTISGLVFVPYTLMHHGWSELALVWKVMTLDPQQQQHFIMFILLFIAGFVELLLSLKKLKGRYWYLVWPSVLFTIGYMFLTHPQHGTAEALSYTVSFHSTLGIVLLLTGLLKIAEVTVESKYKWIAYGWIIFLFIASIMLMSYNEPIGAYHIDPSIRHNSTTQH